MKFLALIPIIIMLQSCGKKNYTKHVENPFSNTANDARLRDLESRLFDIEQRVNGNVQSLELLTQLLEDMGDENTTTTENIEARIEDLEDDTTSLLSTMLEIRGYSITKIIDPCGDSAGFDEVILKTGAGKLIAYFENGASRYLSVIPTGSYRTTDGTNCLFEVTSGGLVLHTVNGVIISE